MKTDKVRSRNRETTDGETQKLRTRGGDTQTEMWRHRDTDSLKEEIGSAYLGK